MYRRCQHKDEDPPFDLFLNQPKRRLHMMLCLKFLKALKHEGKLTNLQAQASNSVFVMTDKCATCEIDASASPLNPYVVIRLKSAKVDSFEVVKRSASIGKSFF